MAKGDDIARTAAFLASAESDYLTGLAISVTGGTHLGKKESSRSTTRSSQDSESSPTKVLLISRVVTEPASRT